MQVIITILILILQVARTPFLEGAPACTQVSAALLYSDAGHCAETDSEYEFERGEWLVC